MRVLAKISNIVGRAAIKLASGTRWIPEFGEGSDEGLPSAFTARRPLRFSDTVALRDFLSQVAKDGLKVTIQMGSGYAPDSKTLDDVDKMVDWIACKPRRARSCMNVTLEDQNGNFSGATIITGTPWKRMTMISTAEYPRLMHIVQTACESSMEPVPRCDWHAAVVEPINAKEESERRNGWNNIKKNLWISGAISLVVSLIVNVTALLL